MTVLPRSFQPCAKQIKNEKSALFPVSAGTPGNFPCCRQEKPGSPGNARYTNLIKNCGSKGPVVLFTLVFAHWVEEKIERPRTGPTPHLPVKPGNRRRRAAIILYFRLSLLIKKIISLQRFLQRGCYLNLKHKDLRLLPELGTPVFQPDTLFAKADDPKILRVWRNW